VALLSLQKPINVMPDLSQKSTASEEGAETASKNETFAREHFATISYDTLPLINMTSAR